MHRFLRRGQRGDESASRCRGRAPADAGGAVGEHADLAGQGRVPTRLFSTMSARNRGEKPKAVALRRKTRREVAVRQRLQVVLDPDLGLRVRGHRAQRGVLVDEVVSPAAPYTEQVDA